MTYQKKTYLKIVGIAALLVLGFQNCLENGTSSMGSGNGQPYVGLQKGTYYSRVKGFECPNGSQGKQYQSVDKMLVINDSGSQAKIVDNCSGEERSIAVSEVRASQLDLHYLTHENSIYESSAQPPDPSLPIPLAVCNFPASGLFLGLQQIITIASDANNSAMVRLSVYAARDPQTGQPVPNNEMPQAVLYSSDQYPAGIAAVTFSNPNIPYELKVSALTDPNDPNTHLGRLDAMVAGSPVGVTGSCVQPGSN